MLLESLNTLIAQVDKYPHLIILISVLLTYGYVIFKSGYVSDDHDGIENYDGTLMYPDESVRPGEAPRKIRKICYGTLSKWVRYHLCGGHRPSRHTIKRPDGTVVHIPSGKIPSHHHLLSILVHATACLLLYHFLLTITTPTVALLTVLLFTAHPTCTQAVAWPSAIGYLLSLVCICSVLLISNWVSPYTDLTHILLGLAGIAFFQVWGVYAQGIPLTTGLILLALGQYHYGVVAILVAGAASFVNLGGYVTHRKEEFKKQNMDQSTSFNFRKPIVALKTIAYYIYLSILPIRMGLYHEWGFHYDKKIELWDWRAIFGLVVTAISAYLFLVTPHQEVRIGILWFYSFIFLFLNWITAQQWVTERYLYIPVIGLCLISSFYLQHLLPLYFLIFGIFICRTWMHLPTYDNEIRFYLSNTWNFQKSEVAFGNLGVAYTQAGLGGAASDMWLISSSINQDYDVPFYNIYSKNKSAALMAIQHGNYEQGIQSLTQCIPMMQRVLDCKVIHFRENWQKEMDELKDMVQNPVRFLIGELNRLQVLRDNLMKLLYEAKEKTRQDEITSSINDNNRQIDALKSYFSSKGINIEYNPEKALLNKLTGGK